MHLLCHESLHQEADAVRRVKVSLDALIYRVQDAAKLARTDNSACDVRSGLCASLIADSKAIVVAIEATLEQLGFTVDMIASTMHKVFPPQHVANDMMFIGCI